MREGAAQLSQDEPGYAGNGQSCNEHDGQLVAGQADIHEKEGHIKQQQGQGVQIIGIRLELHTRQPEHPENRPERTQEQGQEHIVQHQEEPGPHHDVEGISGLSNQEPSQQELTEIIQNIEAQNIFGRMIQDVYQIIGDAGDIMNEIFKDMMGEAN